MTLCVTWPPPQNDGWKADFIIRLYTHWKIRPGKVSQSTINLSLIWAFNDLMIKFNLQNALCLRNLLNAVSNDAWGLKRQFAMGFPSLIWCDDTFLMNFYFITKIALWLRHNGAIFFLESQSTCKFSWDIYIFDFKWPLKLKSMHKNQPSYMYYEGENQ